MTYEVRCRDPNCTYIERFATMRDASNYAEYHALRSGHRDIIMEAVD